MKQGLSRLVALVVLSVVTPLSAQEDPRLAKLPAAETPRVGRYQVVRTSDKDIILLDTATGKLYRATNEDLEPFKNLPTANREPARPVERDGVVLEARGHAAATNPVRVSSPVAGRVAKILFEEGQMVKKGDVLAQIDDRLAKAQYQEAVAAVDAIRELADRLKKGLAPADAENLKATIADLRKQETELDKLLEDIARVTTDGPRNPKYQAILRDRDAVRVRLNQFQQQHDRIVIATPEKVEATQAELKKAEASIARARLNLEAHTILAPRDGIVLEKKLVEGELVNPTGRGAAMICELTDLSSMEIELDIQERDIARVEKGQKCRVMPEAFQKHEAFRKLHPDGLEGVVSRILPVADRTKSAIPVRVKVKVPTGKEGVYLKPGMSAIVSFLKPEK